MRRFILLLVLVAALFGGMAAPVKATYGSVALDFGGTGTLKIGETTLVLVSVETGTNKINGVDMQFSFDKTKLEVVSVEPQLRVGVVGVNQPMFRGSNNVLTKYGATELSTINATGVVGIKGISLLFTKNGTEIVPGETPEEAVAHLSTGKVALLKIVFKDKGSAGNATIALNKSYQTLVTGYNASADDQELSLTDFGTATDSTYRIVVSSGGASCVVLKLDGSQAASCELRSKGDADCNGKIEPVDYSIWRKEFYVLGAGTTARNNWMSNFSCSLSKQKVDITDFNTWRNSCTQKIGQPGVTENGACVL